MITKHACTKGGEFIDGQFYDEYGKPVTPIEHYHADYSYSGQITDSDNNVVVDFIGGGDELSVFDTPEGFTSFNYSKFFLWCFQHLSYLPSLFNFPCT